MKGNKDLENMVEFLKSNHRPFNAYELAFRFNSVARRVQRYLITYVKSGMVEKKREGLTTYEWVGGEKHE